MNIIKARIHDIYQDGWYHDVEILFPSDDRGECYLHVTMGTTEISSFKPVIHEDCVFPNTRVLSASLQSRIGTYNSRLLLYKNKVPCNSGLWSLNHDGWADMSSFEADMFRIVEDRS